MSWDNLPPFEPSPYFRGGHMQTIVSHLLPVEQLSGDFERWIVPLDGGDELWCRFYLGTSSEMVLLFHGLGGSADSKYMQACGTAAREEGHSVLLVNHRGCGEGAEYAAGIYHSGAVSDIAAVLKFARQKTPHLRHTAVGFSLSANLLLTVGAKLSEALPDRIIVVNPPIDLHTTSKLILHPSNFVYDQKFVRDLKIMMDDKFRRGKIQERPALPKFCRLMDFDEIVTAPQAGFKTRDEYYTKCSSLHYAAQIKPPTLILTAEDDPFIPAGPFREAKYPSHVKVRIEKTGGHVGYLSRRGRWLGEFLREALN
jgi:predicted alpha/beta-fold hydrolase